MVKPTVVIAQVLALVIAVLTQNDLIRLSDSIRARYNANMKEAFPRGGTYWQWLFSIVLTSIDGVVGLSATFILIVTSGTGKGISCVSC